MSWPRTRDLVSRDDIARTTARGPIIDKAALQERSSAGAGPDTFLPEPPLDHPLITENYRRYYIEMVEDIAAWLRGAPVRVLR